jgi:hypothetical protein
MYNSTLRRAEHNTKYLYSPLLSPPIPSLILLNISSPHPHPPIGLSALPPISLTASTCVAHPLDHPPAPRLQTPEMKIFQFFRLHS